MTPFAGYRLRGCQEVSSLGRPFGRLSGEVDHNKLVSIKRSLSRHVCLCSQHLQIPLSVAEMRDGRFGLGLCESSRPGSRYYPLYQLFILGPHQKATAKRKRVDSGRSTGSGGWPTKWGKEPALQGLHSARRAVLERGR
jgi:hypothetical protein